jgi:hypothetical protein
MQNNMVGVIESASIKKFPNSFVINQTTLIFAPRLSYKIQKMIQKKHKISPIFPHLAPSAKWKVPQFPP